MTIDQQPQTEIEIIDSFLGSSVSFPAEEGRKVTRSLEDRKVGYREGYAGAKEYIRHMLREAGLDDH